RKRTLGCNGLELSSLIRFEDFGLIVIKLRHRISSEQRPGRAGRGRVAKMLVGAAGGDPAAGGALEEALLNEIGLVEILERPSVLAHGHRQSLDAGRAAVIVLDKRGEDLAVQIVEAELVDLQKRQGLLGGVE